MKSLIGINTKPLILICILFSNASASEILEGRIVGVHDGDTVTLLALGNKQVRIRLAQIDAPELGQAFGQQSKKSLSNMVFGQTARIEQETIDKYGRIVGTIFVSDQDVNKEQVKRGMAWVYPKYAYDQTLYALEAGARSAVIGLWSEPNPLPPWIFRHPERSLPIPQKVSGSESGGSCGNKRFCKDMVSCDEAKHYLTQCGISRLDKDGDDIPCESLCKHTK